MSNQRLFGLKSIQLGRHKKRYGGAIINENIETEIVPDLENLEGDLLAQALELRPATRFDQEDLTDITYLPDRMTLSSTAMRRPEGTIKTRADFEGDIPTDQMSYVPSLIYDESNIIDDRDWNKGKPLLINRQTGKPLQMGDFKLPKKDDPDPYSPKNIRKTSNIEPAYAMRPNTPLEMYNKYIDSQTAAVYENERPKVRKLEEIEKQVIQDAQRGVIREYHDYLTKMHPRPASMSPLSIQRPLTLKERQKMEKDIRAANEDNITAAIKVAGMSDDINNKRTRNIFWDRIKEPYIARIPMETKDLQNQDPTTLSKADKEYLTKIEKLRKSKDYPGYDYELSLQEVQKRLGLAEDRGYLDRRTQGWYDPIISPLKYFTDYEIIQLDKALKQQMPSNYPERNREYVEARMQFMKSRMVRPQDRPTGVYQEPVEYAPVFEGLTEIEDMFLPFLEEEEPDFPPVYAPEGGDMDREFEQEIVLNDLINEYEEFHNQSIDALELIIDILDESEPEQLYSEQDRLASHLSEIKDEFADYVRSWQAIDDITPPYIRENIDMLTRALVDTVSLFNDIYEYQLTLDDLADLSPVNDGEMMDLVSDSEIDEIESLNTADADLMDLVSEREEEEKEGDSYSDLDFEEIVNYMNEELGEEETKEDTFAGEEKEGDSDSDFDMEKAFMELGDEDELEIEEEEEEDDVEEVTAPTVYQGSVIFEPIGDIVINPETDEQVSETFSDRLDEVWKKLKSSVKKKASKAPLEMKEMNKYYREEYPNNYKSKIGMAYNKRIQILKERFKNDFSVGQSLADPKKVDQIGPIFLKKLADEGLIKEEHKNIDSMDSQTRFAAWLYFINAHLSPTSKIHTDIFGDMDIQSTPEQEYYQSRSGKATRSTVRSSPLDFALSKESKLTKAEKEEVKSLYYEKMETGRHSNESRYNYLVSRKAKGYKENKKYIPSLKRKKQEKQEEFNPTEEDLEYLMELTAPEPEPEPKKKRGRPPKAKEEEEEEEEVVETRSKPLATTPRLKWKDIVTFEKGGKKMVDQGIIDFFDETWETYHNNPMRGSKSIIEGPNTKKISQLDAMSDKKALADIYIRRIDKLKKLYPNLPDKYSPDYYKLKDDYVDYLLDLGYQGMGQKKPLTRELGEIIRNQPLDGQGVYILYLFKLLADEVEVADKVEQGRRGPKPKKDGSGMRGKFKLIKI